MADPILATLQGAVSTLRASSAVAALVAGRIYDRPPQEPLPASPYISLGPHDATTDVVADCIDGLDLTFQVDAWAFDAADAKSRVVVTELAGAVRKALHKHEIMVAGTPVWILHRQTRVMRDPDGGYHAALSFGALVDLL